MIGSGVKLDIKEKIMMDCDQLIENGPINIVAFGDSVTHGAFAYGEIDFDAVYWNLLRKKICGVRNYVPVNMINAGIGGITAARSVDRMDSQVFVHNPDLLITARKTFMWLRTAKLHFILTVSLLMVDM